MTSDENGPKHPLTSSSDLTYSESEVVRASYIIGKNVNYPNKLEYRIDLVATESGGSSNHGRRIENVELALDGLSTKVRALDAKLDYNFLEFTGRIDLKLENEFEAFTGRIDVNMEKKFEDYTSRIDTNMEKKVEDYTSRIDASMEKKFEDYTSRIDANMEKKFEAERVRNQLTVATMAIVSIIPLFVAAAWMVDRYDDKLGIEVSKIEKRIEIISGEVRDNGFRIIDSARVNRKEIQAYFSIEINQLRREIKSNKEFQNNKNGKGNK